ncbi:MAG: FG-GAP-like repeat-containing protein [Planctomycetaceae bacterium]
MFSNSRWQALGDIDGDGIGDIAVGSSGFDLGLVRNGAVYVLRLNSDGTVKSGGITQIANGTNGGPSLPVVAQFGRSVASLGDINGDGVGDLAVGAFGEDSYAGAVYVLLMNSDGTVSSSTRIASGVNGGPTLASSSRFGISLASLGDIDGDETGDVAIGIRGAVYVARLNTDGTVKSHTLLSNPTLGISASVNPALATAGDLDGNGVTDLLVGSDSDNSVDSLFLHADGTLAGKVRISSGINGGPSVAGTSFGTSVSSLGDLDGDGVVDILVGARSDDTGGQARGAAYILRLDAATFDFGDAPDTGSGAGAGNYATTLGDGGPRHIINSGLRLGAAIDAEANATANAAANGDGLDEDGVLFPLTDLQFTIGSQPTVTLRATNTTGTAATLYGWVDYNGNGVFDNATERASVGSNGHNQRFVHADVPDCSHGLHGQDLCPIPVEHGHVRERRDRRRDQRRSGRLRGHDRHPVEWQAETEWHHEDRGQPEWRTVAGKPGDLWLCSGTSWRSRRRRQWRHRGGSCVCGESGLSRCGVHSFSEC